MQTFKCRVSKDYVELDRVPGGEVIFITTCDGKDYEGVPVMLAQETAEQLRDALTEWLEDHNHG